MDVLDIITTGNDEVPVWLEAGANSAFTNCALNIDNYTDMVGITPGPDYGVDKGYLFSLFSGWIFQQIPLALNSDQVGLSFRWANALNDNLNEVGHYEAEKSDEGCRLVIDYSLYRRHSSDIKARWGYRPMRLLGLSLLQQEALRHSSSISTSPISLNAC